MVAPQLFQRWAKVVLQFDPAKAIRTLSLTVGLYETSGKAPRLIDSDRGEVTLARRDQQPVLCPARNEGEVRGQREEVGATFDPVRFGFREFPGDESFELAARATASIVIAQTAAP